MADWLIERGIGETRAILMDGDTVIGTRLHWPGDMQLGAVQARLIRRAKGATRGLASTADGHEINLSGLPAKTSEGSMIAVRVTRTPMAEHGRLKRAQGVYLPHDAPVAKTDGTGLPSGREVRQFPSGLWESAWHDAWEGSIEFAGGSLIASATPAMTVIDIDGDYPPRELALAAVPAIADMVRRFDLGGSIGIDFPTLPDKAQRRAVDTALAEALADWPHERTAMNGFGFVQLVARLERPSLLHRLQFNRASAAARMLLRRGELAEGNGPRLMLRAHPGVIDRIADGWLDELARRSGRQVVTERDPALALEAGHAQILQS